MLFLEAKTKFEFGLMVIGCERYEYHLVTQSEWEERSDACALSPHQMDDMGKVCGSCKIMYIKAEVLGTISDEALVSGITELARLFRERILT